MQDPVKTMLENSSRRRRESWWRSYEIAEKTLDKKIYTSLFIGVAFGLLSTIPALAASMILLSSHLYAVGPFAISTIALGLGSLFFITRAGYFMVRRDRLRKSWRDD